MCLVVGVQLVCIDILCFLLLGCMWLIGSLDGMVYTRGAASDYDDWASVTRDDGWRWDSLRRFIQKVRLGTKAWRLRSSLIWASFCDVE